MNPKTCTALTHPWTNAFADDDEEPVALVYSCAFGSFAEYTHPHTGLCTGKIIPGGDVGCETEKHS